MNWTKKPLLTRAEKANLTRQKNMRKHKLVRAYVWYLAYSFVTILTIAFVASLYVTMLSTTIEAVKTPVEAVKAEIKPLQESIEDRIRAVGGEYGSIMVKLAKCESSLQQYATNANKNDTVDRGVFQINSIHKDITDECTFNVECAGKWTKDKLSKNQGHIWTCWKKL